MLINTGRDRKDVRIEDDIFRWEADLLGQYLVSASADFDFALFRISLPGFIKCHDHNRRAIGADQSRMIQKGFLAFFERDGIDDGLALHAFKTSFDHVPFRTIDHHWHASDVRLSCNQVEILNHDLLAVDQSFIHIDVDDLRAVFHLIAGNNECCRIITSRNQLAKAGRAGNVGALTDIDEGNLFGQRERLKARQAHQWWHVNRLARRMLGDSRSDCANMVRRRATATANHVDEAFTREIFDLRGHCFRAFVVLTEFIRQTGIWIGTDKRIGDACDFRQMLAHRIGAERAIKANGERLGMAQRIPECRRRLAGKRTT